MQTNINHQSARPPHFIAQSSKTLVSGFVDPHFFAQVFCVEPPAFAKSTDVILLSEGVHIIKFSSAGVLQVMARNSLMQCQCR